MCVEFKLREYTYKAMLVPWDDEKLFLGGEHHFGSCEWKTQTIFIRDDLVPTMLRRVVLHEVTHAVSEAYGFFGHIDSFNREDIAEFCSVYAMEIIEITELILDGFKVKAGTQPAT